MNLQESGGKRPVGHPPYTISSSTSGFLARISVSASIPPQFLPLWGRLLSIGIFLAPTLIILILISLLSPGSATLRTWVNRSAFCAATAWVTILGSEWHHRARAGGFGIDSNSVVLVAGVAILSGVLGVFAFDSWWRLLAILPLVAFVYFLFPFSIS